MKSKLNRVGQLLLFLSIGVCVFWYLYKDQDWGQMAQTIADADFKWIWLSLCFGVVSHWARAQRWRMLIGATGGNVKAHNALMAVFVGYLANLVFPRMGEVTRCGVLSKYNKLSFATLAGTVLVERLTDLIFLVLVILFAFVLEFGMLSNFVSQKISFVWLLDLFTSVWWWLFLVALVALVWFVLRKAVQMAVFRRFKDVWGNFVGGFKSLKALKQKKSYLFYSVLIWAMYFMMQYTAFFSMASTSGLTPVAGLVILATGSIGMLAPVQGGVGTWHGMVIATLVLYGVASESASAFALLVHGSQHLLVVVGGIISFVLFPLINTSPKKHVEG